MNYFISGIIKIAILEGSIALLIFDRLAPDRFARAQRAVISVLAGLMVFAWTNYGDLRGGPISVPYLLTALPLCLGLGWLFGAAFSGHPSARMKAFRDRLRRTSGNPMHAPIAITLAVILAWSWVWVGHRAQAIPLVHPWEQYHFYLGAKYQKEVGWFDLYKATVIADGESGHVLDGLRTIRDTATFELVPAQSALADADRIRARFGSRRWEAFKADWAAMARPHGINWTHIVNDHGNSNSPVWSIIAHPLARLVPLSAENQSFLGWIDMILMLFLWLFLYETFGHRLSCIGLLLWATPPNVFDYLAGSYLRWDWLFALGLAAAFIKRGHYATAGVFFGYSVASKIFPVFFGIALLLRAVRSWWSTRRFERKYLHFATGAIVSGLILVLISSAMFGVEAWREYAQRIEAARIEKYYPAQYSLKTVFLQFAAPGASALKEGIFPGEIKQARAGVDIRDYGLVFLLVRLVFTLAVVILVWRANNLEAFLLGPLLVFTWLTVNMYYWNMLGLLAIGLASRRERPFFGMVIFQHLLFMIFFLYQHFNRRFAEPYVVSFLMCGWILGSAMWVWWEQSRLSRTGAVGCQAA